MSLAAFSPAARVLVRRSSFDAPTDAQSKGWPPIAEGRHTLLLAPTGSGKTLAAFLWAIDRLAADPPPEPEARTRVLYISPLRALAVDIEKNLRAPLAGIQAAAERRGTPLAHVPTVGVRTGRHRRPRASPTAAHASRHPDHDARIALPDADLVRRARRCAASRP